MLGLLIRPALVTVITSATFFVTSGFALAQEERPWHRYYPTAALEAGVSGSATIDCGVNDEGGLDCVVVEETPEGWGFGEAVLSISRHFRIPPESRAQVLDENGRLRRTVAFEPPSENEGH